MRYVTSTLMIGLWFLAVGIHPAHGARFLEGVAGDGSKVYIGPTSVQSTNAFEQFQLGSGSEFEKLCYLLERVSHAKECSFHYQGGRYSLQDALFAGNWLLFQRYNRDQKARDFIREQISFYDKPSRPVLIEFPNGTRYRIVDVLLNELDLLEHQSVVES